jgi:hypothetical protein
MKTNFLTVAVAVIALSATVSGQTSGPAGAPAKSASTATGGPGGGEVASGPGFSIETEMFTYKALEENSETVACDVARHLYGSGLGDAPSGSHAPCMIKNAGQATPGIVILSFDSKLLSDFQTWRADMATMSDLEARASKVCVAPAPSSGTANPSVQGSTANQVHGSEAEGKGAGFTDLTPAGQAVSLIGDALRMFSSDQSVSAVVGTVKDEALMAEVARQLRSLNVLVLVPELYNPNALNRADYSNSLYFQNMENLFDSYGKCETERAKYSATDPAAKQIDIVIDGIEAFKSAAMPTAGSQKPSETNGNGAAGQPSQTVPSHFAVVFAADEVARQLGFKADGSGSSATWQHVLLLKALESGGSVTKESSIIFGTKVRFSGGAVDTFAVFRLDGELVCSGNVYNFQSPVRIKDLQKSFRAGTMVEPTDAPELRSTCAMLPPPKTN